MVIIPTFGWMTAGAVLSCHRAIPSASSEIIQGNNYGRVCLRKDVRTILPG